MAWLLLLVGGDGADPLILVVAVVNGLPVAVTAALVVGFPDH